MFDLTFDVSYSNDRVLVDGLPDIKEIDNAVYASQVSIKEHYIGCVYNREQQEITLNFLSEEYVSYSYNDELLMTEIVNNLTNMYTMRKDAVACISQKCENTIISGFKSNSLGSLHIYDSEMVDQINLVGSVIATSPIPPAFPDGFPQYYATRDAASNVKTYELHTHAQLRRVLQDGAYFKLYILQVFHQKRIMIENATSREEILAITWDSEQILNNFVPLP